MPEAVAKRFRESGETGKGLAKVRPMPEAVASALRKTDTVAPAVDDPVEEK